MSSYKSVPYTESTIVDALIVAIKLAVPNLPSNIHNPRLRPSGGLVDLDQICLAVARGIEHTIQLIDERPETIYNNNGNAKYTSYNVSVDSPQSPPPPITLRIDGDYLHVDVSNQQLLHFTEYVETVPGEAYDELEINTQPSQQLHDQHPIDTTGRLYDTVTNDIEPLRNVAKNATSKRLIINEQDMVLRLGCDMAVDVTYAVGFTQSDKIVFSGVEKHKCGVIVVRDGLGICLNLGVTEVLFLDGAQNLLIGVNMFEEVFALVDGLVAEGETADALGVLVLNNPLVFSINDVIRTEIDDRYGTVAADSGGKKPLRFVHVRNDGEQIYEYVKSGSAYRTSFDSLVNDMWTDKWILHIPGSKLCMTMNSIDVFLHTATVGDVIQLRQEHSGGTDNIMYKTTRWFFTFLFKTGYEAANALTFGEGLLDAYTRYRNVRAVNAAAVKHSGTLKIDMRPFLPIHLHQSDESVIIVAMRDWKEVHSGMRYDIQ